MISTSEISRRIRGKRVLIDSNIIIYLTDCIAPFADLSRRIFDMVEAGDSEAVFSILSIAEVMQGPIRNQEPRIAVDVKEYLSNFPNSRCQEITGDVLDRVGVDSRIAWEKLRTADSLIIASGLSTEVDLFISNDLHFSKAIPSAMLVTFR